jgi:hypothetical protein
MTDDLEWFAALPKPVRAALLAEPGAALPPDLIARLPRLYRPTYGTDDPVTGCWTLRPRYAEELHSAKRAAECADTPYR